MTSIPADWLRQLQETELFRDLDPELYDMLATELTRLYLPSGSVLFHQGDPGDAVYVVITGRLRVVYRQPDGQTVVLGEIGRGETVGEMALLTGEPRSATVMAVRDSELARLSEDGFRALMSRKPELALHLARRLVIRLRRTMARRTVHPYIGAIAVVPVRSDVPVREWVDRLAHALAHHGRTIVLTRTRVDREIGAQVANTPLDPPNYRLVEWLDRVERQHRFVLYVADDAPSNGARRCLRQADRVLLLYSGDRRPEASPLDPLVTTVAQEREPDLLHTIIVHTHAKSAPTETRRYMARCPQARVFHVRMNVDADFARLARYFAGTAIGLVLSGGGARGFAHIGVIRAIQEAEIPIDAIGGVSMGAVIAAQYAMGMQPDDMVAFNRKWWVDFQPLRDYTLPLVSLIRGRKVVYMLQQMFGDLHIEDLWIPYFCVSTNLSRARLEVHRTGPLWMWVRASISIPGIGPPLAFRGDLYVDGGVMNNLPVDIMHRFCPGPVIASDTGVRLDLQVDPDWIELPGAWDIVRARLRKKSAVAVPTLYEILYRTATLGSTRVTEQLRALADLYLHPPVEPFGLFETNAIERLVEIGYTYARSQLRYWRPSLRARPAIRSTAPIDRQSGTGGAP